MSIVGLLGTGLIGASLGLSARVRGEQVVGWDREPASLEAALACGALSQACADTDELFALAQTLVIAVPLDATLEWLDRLALHPPAQAELILDVASLKGPVVERAAGLERFVATHPLAGSERSGAGAARASLFSGASWAYVPSGREALDERARTLIRSTGALPVSVSARDHDRAVALSSHLPQLLAVLLAQRLGSGGDELTFALCGSGMRSMVRLAGSSWPMWQGIFAHGGTALAQEVRMFGDVLAQAAAELDAQELEALAVRFDRARDAAARIRANDSSSPNVEGCK